MSHNGWTNEHTWGVAAAADNTEPFQATRDTVVDTFLAGEEDTAYRLLQDAVERGELRRTLASWVDPSAVAWDELVRTWAAEDA